MFSKKNLAFTFICFISSALCYGQMSLPIKKIGNTDFYYYKVEKKETLFGIAKKLSISQESILKYNPSVSDGLQEKSTLFFPVETFKGQKTQAASASTQPVKAITNVPADFTHLVGKGETLYGIAKTYNVSQESIIAQNPSAEKGLRQGQVLIIPQPKVKESAPTASTPTAAKNAPATKVKKEIIYHTIAKGETLYSLSKQFGTTIEKILDLNPGISPSNFKINEVVKISTNSAEPVIVEKEISTIVPYEVKKGDTFYSVARINSITVEELVTANPNVKTLKKGKIINIPVTHKEKIAQVETEGNQSELSDNKSSRIKEIYDSVHTLGNTNEINVALMLPYMLKKEKPSKAARLYTEFYKGFLLAVDDARKSTDKKINIYAYDTEDSQKTLDSLLCIPKMKKMDVIFAPDEIEQINALSNFGKKNDVNIINTFSVKNEDYNTNPRIFQVNIPHSYMFAEVTDRFDNIFQNYEVVFLHHTGSESKDFALELKKHLCASNAPFKTHSLQYGNALQSADVDKIIEPGKKYVFVPLSSSKHTLAQILPALKKVKADRFDADIAMFGYPEWSTYPSDYKDDFQTLDTYIYTRFFVDSSAHDVKQFESRYKRWYGENMMYAAPQFGFLGYDVGLYFLKSLASNGKDFNNGGISYNGLQTDFNFQRLSNWSGFVNKSVYIVHFTPFNLTEKTTK